MAKYASVLFKSLFATLVYGCVAEGPNVSQRFSFHSKLLILMHARIYFFLNSNKRFVFNNNNPFHSDNPSGTPPKCFQLLATDQSSTFYKKSSLLWSCCAPAPAGLRSSYLVLSSWVRTGVCGECGALYRRSCSNLVTVPVCQYGTAFFASVPLVPVWHRPPSLLRFHTNTQCSGFYMLNVKNGTPVTNPILCLVP